MNPGIYGVGSATLNTMPYGVNGVPATITVQATVVAGGGVGAIGGAAATRPGPGGGGGGVISDARTLITLGIAYPITIGAGAAGGAGNHSRFADFSAVGGGGAQTSGNPAFYATTGGSISLTRYSSFISSQGFGGGIGNSISTAAGGGGGSGGAGFDAVVGQNGDGGIGRLSSTPVTPTYYGGGGGAGCNTNSGSVAAHGVGGAGGGGNGGTSAGVNPTAGAANTGGGSGGGGVGTGSGAGSASGGSGVVVLRYSQYYKIRLGTGLTGSTTNSGSDSVTIITAGTGTVVFN